MFDMKILNCGFDVFLGLNCSDIKTYIKKIQNIKYVNIEYFVKIITKYLTIIYVLKKKKKSIIKI